MLFQVLKFRNRFQNRIRNRIPNRIPNRIRNRFGIDLEWIQYAFNFQ